MEPDEASEVVARRSATAKRSARSRASPANPNHDPDGNLFVPEKVSWGLVQYLAAISFILFWASLLVWIHFATSAPRPDLKGPSAAADFKCVDIGTSRISASHNFTFVVLGHMLFSENSLRQSLKAITPHVRKGDNIVFGLVRTVTGKDHTNIIKNELYSLLQSNPVTICSSGSIHRAWRGLWAQSDLVGEDFIILDEIAKLESKWRSWYESTRKIFHSVLISLQGIADSRLVSYSDRGLGFEVDPVPAYAALLPSMKIWKAFLDWFDSNPDEIFRVGAERLLRDVRDHFPLQALGSHSGWAKSFSQFSARSRLNVVHAMPPLAYSTHEVDQSNTNSVI